MNEYGLRLKELMDKKGIRQMDVCKEAFIDSSHMSRICNGTTDIQLETLRRITIGVVDIPLIVANIIITTDIAAIAMTPIFIDLA